MASVHFTKNMRRHVDCPNEAAAGSTVAQVLNDYFSRHPAVRTYVLDEQGSVRRHVAVFLDGTQITDPASLSDPIGDQAEIYVMQALSGG